MNPAIASLSCQKLERNHVIASEAVVLDVELVEFYTYMC